jgi:sensor histidine kinase YesM
MLLIPLVENAFKHSVGNGDDPVNIRLKLSYTDSILVFEVENSIVASSANTAPDDIKRHSGIGLSNVQRRLDLLYPNCHTFVIKSSPTHYWVRMEIDLSN